MDGVFQCLEKLAKVIEEERQLTFIDDIQRSVKLNADMQILVESADDNLGRSEEFLDRIKSNLGMDRGIADEIEEATTEYNIAICQGIGRKILSALPLELRDMIYQHLIPHKVHISINRKNQRQPLVNQSGNIARVGLYFSGAPRSAEDVVCPEHFWRDEALGPKLAQELMLCFYRSCSFSIDSTDMLSASPADDVVSILNVDRFALDIQPQHLISNIVRYIRVDADRAFDPSGWSSNVLALLGELQLLKANASIRLVFLLQLTPRFAQPQQGLRIFDLRMKLVLAELVSLRQKGYRLDMELACDWYYPQMKKAIRKWVDHIEGEARMHKTTLDMC